MISNLVRNTDFIEFDFTKEDRVIHIKISGNQDDEAIEGAEDVTVTQYTSEQLYLIAANQMAFIEGDFTPSHPTETLAQIKAWDSIRTDAKFGEEDFTGQEFVLF